jgi:SAM-dependent methyltransferase
MVTFVKNTGRRLAGSLRNGARVFEAWLLGPGHFSCNVCLRPVRAFRPLPDFYARELRKHGWPYSLEQAETCNAAQYTCPWCGSSDRDRLLAQYFRVYWKNRPPADVFRMIDFAPSKPLSACFRRTLAEKAPTAIYRTADLFASEVDDRVDLTDMKDYADSTWDFFVCSHVLEHVPDDRKALRELFRILKPGGTGLLLAPIILGLNAVDEDPTVTDSAERWRRFGQDDHVRLYSKAGFVERIGEAGFALEEWGTNDPNRVAEFRRNGIKPASVLYVASKRQARAENGL